MDQELQKLIRSLQDETCPPAVLDRVAERISREKRSTPRLRVSLVWTAAVAGLLAIASVWQWRAQREAQAQAAEFAAAQAQAKRAIVLQQTQEAFGYIGHALLRAANHTENSISKEAIPPLRDSFETIKTKVTKSI